MLYGKFVRIERGLSQRALARLSGVFNSEISLIEAGRLLPTDKQRALLARVLGCDPARLLEHVTAAPLGSGAEARDAQREADRG